MNALIRHEVTFRSVDCAVVFNVVSREVLENPARRASLSIVAKHIIVETSNIVHAGKSKSHYLRYSILCGNYCGLIKRFVAWN
jgi:hypothetical protein